MTLLRAAARTMLASYFITSGVRAARSPAAQVPTAEPVADRVVPLIKRYAPNQVARYLPEDALTLVRVNAAVQIAGGLALATGKGRRLGAWALAGSLLSGTAAKYPFWSRQDAEQKASDRAHFAKNLSLLGGLLIAAQDTEGRPSLAWRAAAGGKALAKGTRKTSGTVVKKAKKLGDSGSGLADNAKAGGAAFVGGVVASSRKARQQAAKQAAKARKQAQENAKQAKKEAPKQARAQRKAAALAAKQAAKQAPEVAKVAEVAKAAKHTQLQAKQETAQVQRRLRAKREVAKAAAVEKTANVDNVAGKA